jgi:hypothetical protein
MSDLAKYVVQARTLCGCTACEGGYHVGERTLAMGVGDRRPSSCVASVVLAALLDGKEAADGE